PNVVFSKIAWTKTNIILIIIAGISPTKLLDIEGGTPSGILITKFLFTIQTYKRLEIKPIIMAANKPCAPNQSKLKAEIDPTSPSNTDIGVTIKKESSEIIPGKTPSISKEL